MGGGQLALMLVEAAQILQLPTKIYCQKETDPAAKICGDRVIGSPDDLDLIKKFFSTVDTVLFENEFSPFDQYQKAAIGLNVEFCPNLNVMKTLSDKAKQKEVLSELNIETAKFTVCSDEKNLNEWVGDALKRFGEDVVFKWGSRGYDGKGLLISPKKTEQAAILSFARETISHGGRVYAEEKIPFKRELAILGCVSKNGEFANYPLVVSEQKNGICSVVTGPASKLGVDPQHEVKAIEYVRKLAEGLKIVGTFAVELFETVDGRILVNEIAPRVHNSGHYSQDCCKTSQFENHLHAALGMPLGEVSTTPFFGMYNLLGPTDPKCERNLSNTDFIAPFISPLTQPFIPPFPPPQIVDPDIFIHWYGKDVMMPRRKMGHVNVIANDHDQLIEKLEQVYKSEKSWYGSLAPDV